MKYEEIIDLIDKKTKDNRLEFLAKVKIHQSQWSNYKNLKNIPNAETLIKMLEAADLTLCLKSSGPRISSDNMLNAKPGEIFATGSIINDYNFCIVKDRIGDSFRFVCVRGNIDWAMYIAWEDEGYSDDYIAQSGDKVQSRANVQVALLQFGEPDMITNYRF